MTAADKIAKIRELPPDGLGVFLSSHECAWLLDAAEALDNLMSHLDVDTETMTVRLGDERAACFRIGYFPSDAPVIDGALAALADKYHCSRCGSRHPWRDMSPATHECAECMASDVFATSEGIQ
jgi:hypothetical protein